MSKNKVGFFATLTLAGAFGTLGSGIWRGMEYNKGDFTPVTETSNERLYQNYETVCELLYTESAPCPEPFIRNSLDYHAAAGTHTETQTPVISMTKGLFHILDDDEQQAVLAHEFGHVYEGHIHEENGPKAEHVADEYAKQLGLEEPLATALVKIQKYRQQSGYPEGLLDDLPCDVEFAQRFEKAIDDLFDYATAEEEIKTTEERSHPHTGDRIVKLVGEKGLEEIKRAFPEVTLEFSEIISPEPTGKKINAPKIER